MASKVEIEIDTRSPNRLGKEELEAEMMLLWTSATKLGQRHKLLQAEWDTRKVKATLDGIVEELIPKPPPPKPTSPRPTMKRRI
jgi:hypothetical protein